MDEKHITYIVYESGMARSERHIKRLIIALVICIFLIFISNAAWLYAWYQYDYSSEEITYSQDGEGMNLIGDSNHATDSQD